MSLSRLILKPVTIVLILAVTLSGMPAYAVTDTAGDFALAPPLATKPPCQIVQKPDGSFDVVTNNDVIESWDRETVRSVQQGETLGKAFRNRWAFVDVSYLIGQMLILARDHKLQNPKDILIPLIKKHIRNRNGVAEILLEGYDIDGIEEVREGSEITGFSLPVSRNGAPAYRLVYNLRDGDTSIPLDKGTSVYIITKSIEPTSAMDVKNSSVEILPDSVSSVKLAFDLMNAVLGFNRSDFTVKEDFNLMITYKCPFDCGHCLAKQARNAGKGRDVPKQRLYSILDQFRGFKKIHIVGTGEPMAYGTWQDFIDVITYATECIDEVRSVTNGYRIPETFEEAETFFKQIPDDVRKKVVWVISVDKYHEKQMQSRMKKSLVKIVNIMEQLAGKGIVKTAYNVRVSESQEGDEALKHFGLVNKNTRDPENVFVNTLIGQGYARDNFKMEAHSLSARDISLHSNSTKKVFLFIDPEGFIVTSDHFAYMTHDERTDSPLYRHSVLGRVQNDMREIGRAIIKRLFGRNLADLNVDGSYNDFQIEVFCRKFFKDTLSKAKSKSARKKLEKILVASTVDTLSALFYYHTGDLHRAKTYMDKVNSRDRKIKTAMGKFVQFLSNKVKYIDDVGFVSDCVKANPDHPHSTVTTETLSTIRSHTIQSQDSKPLDRGTIHPTTERIHTTNLQDTINYIQAQSAFASTSKPEGASADKPQSQPLIVALGTSWIKGYEKGRYLQYDALNPLIGNIRSYCESKGIPFIIDDDDKLPARINAERAKEGKQGAKVVVLAGKDTVASDEFAPFRNDQKNAFVVGVDNQELTTDSYIRLMEMLTLALKLSVGFEISQDSTPIKIVKDDKLHIYIFIPHAEPMNYEQLKMIYEVQKFA